MLSIFELMILDFTLFKKFIIYYLIIILASYDDARKKLVDAEFTSTLETDVELQPTIEYQRPKRNEKTFPTLFGFFRFFRN